MRSKTTLMILALGAFLSGVNAELIVNGGFEAPAHTANDGTNPDNWSVFETTLGTNPIMLDSCGKP
ncbi:hypothetical protein P4C99_21170 [Pontiellaceae bacterium B1224]|nr:hypothetical protein [Pontiellaceae bacterium B1224]